MSLNQYLTGANCKHNLIKDQLIEKNIIEKKGESLLISSVYLLKISFLFLAFVSLIKIGYLTQLRLSRLQEIKNSYLHEKDKFIKLTNRFDDLFSHEGEQRFMKDQDQMISRDVMRVIWR